MLRTFNEIDRSYKIASWYVTVKDKTGQCIVNMNCGSCDFSCISENAFLWIPGCSLPWSGRPFTFCIFSCRVAQLCQGCRHRPHPASRHHAPGNRISPDHHAWGDTHCRGLQGDPGHGGAGAADLGQPEEPPKLQHLGAQGEGVQPRVRATQAKTDPGNP